MAVGRRSGLVLSLLLLAALLGYGGWRFWRAWGRRATLAEVRGQIPAGRHAAAARNLEALLAREPRCDEAAYLLGVCEKARGRIDPALAAWERVPVDSPFAAAAVQARAATLADRGRLADAEELVNKTLADPRIDGYDLLRFLGSLYSKEGRHEDARRAVEANWERLDRAGRGGSGLAIELVRRHIALGSETASAESVRGYLDRAGRLAPGDDRVWLGKAILATRRGAFDEAANWLNECRRSRPDDPAVWAARLEWAMAAGRVAEAREALEHRPAGDADPARRHRVAAWLAARRADGRSERRALEDLLAADPADGSALDRLAELAVLAGQPDRAADLRRRKGEVDRAEERYRQLLRRNQPLRDAAELSRLADGLGRPFEARAFRTVAAVAGAWRRGDKP